MNCIILLIAMVLISIQSMIKDIHNLNFINTFQKSVYFLTFSLDFDSCFANYIFISIATFWNVSISFFAYKQ